MGRGRISEKFALVRRTTSLGKLLVRQKSYLSEKFWEKKPLLFYKYTTVGDNMCIDQTSPFYYLNRSYRTIKSGHNVYYNILFKLTVDDEFSGIKQMKNNDENFDRNMSWQHMSTPCWNLAVYLIPRWYYFRCNYEIIFTPALVMVSWRVPTKLCFIQRLIVKRLERVPV